MCYALVKNVLLMRKRKGWLLAIAVVAVLVLSHPVYAPSIIRVGDDYLTVSELKVQAESLYGQQVRVGGRVAPGLIDWDDRTNVMRFALTEDEELLPMVYQGIVPNTFKPGADLVVEGVYHPDGMFEVVGFGSRGSFCNICH